MSNLANDPTELKRRVARLIEGELGAGERAELETALTADANLRAYYLDYIELHSLLHQGHVSPQELNESVLSSQLSVVSDQPVGHALRDKQPQPAERARASEGSRACEESEPNAVAICAATEGKGGSLIDTSDSARKACPTPRSKKSWLDRAAKRPVRPALAIAALVMISVVAWMGVTTVKTRLAGGGNKSTDELQEPTKPEFVAWLMKAHETQWLDGTEPKHTRLDIGQRLAIAKGLIEIQYITGATVVLVGPAEYEVLGKKSGYLKVGKLTAQVEGETAKGFIVETPTTTFEDLGTEFGVRVALNGTARMHVFDGEVRVRPNSETAGGPSFVTAGNGVVVEWNKVTAVGSSALAGSFIRSIRAGHPVTMNTFVLIDENFATGRASGTTWTSESTGPSAGQKWVWSAPKGRARPIQTEVWKGREGASARELADSYDHDQNTVTSDIDVQGGIEVMSQFESDVLPLMSRVGVRVRLPDNLDERHDGMLTAFVANRLNGDFGGNGPLVSVFNITDERELLPLQTLLPFSPNGNAGWNLKAFPIKLTSDDAGDTIEIRFAERIVAGAAPLARGLQVADVHLSVIVTRDEFARTGKSAVDVSLPTE